MDINEAISYLAFLRTGMARIEIKEANKVKGLTEKEIYNVVKVGMDDQQIEQAIEKAEIKKSLALELVAEKNLSYVEELLLFGVVE